MDIHFYKELLELCCNRIGLNYTKFLHYVFHFYPKASI